MENFQYANNPITEKVYGSGVISRTLRNQETGETITLKSESFNGAATFQYDAVIRDMFGEGRTLFPSCSHCYKDKALRVLCTIGSNSYVFVRAVAQKGDVDFIEEASILSTMPILRYYPDYELTISFPADGNGDLWTITNNGAVMDSGMAEALKNVSDLVTFLIEDAESGNIKYESLGYIPAEMPIKVCEVPAHPFYVRWINHLGGYDYFMFSCRQLKKKSLSSSSYYEKYNSYGEYTTISKQGVETIETSTGIIDQETYKAIAGMIYSPDIRYYDAKLDEWIKIQVSQADLEWFSDQPTAEFTMSFLLPNPQIAK